MKKIKKVLLTLAIIKFTVLNAQTPFNTQYIDIGGNFIYSQIWNASTEQKNRILLLHRYGLVECDSNLTPTKLVTSSSFGNYPAFVWGGAIIARKGIYLINNPNNFQTNPIVVRWNNSMTNTIWVTGGGMSTGTLNLGQASGPST